MSLLVLNMRFLITKPFLGKFAGNRCHKSLQSIGAYQVDLPVQNIIIFSPLMVVYLTKALITCECKSLEDSFRLKKKSSTNTSTMFLLYIILNLCIAGKLNKILIYKSVFFNLLPYPESLAVVYGGEAFTAKLTYFWNRG